MTDASSARGVVPQAKNGFALTFYSHDSLIEALQ
jgi:hypothetical protein